MKKKTSLWALIVMLLTPALTEARITQIVIDRRESPTFEGVSFGEVGQYEKLVGVAYGEVDLDHPLNAGIVNLDRAPRNAQGMVEYNIDVHIFKPIDMKRGNGTIFYTVVNRGNAGLTFHIGAGGGNDPTTAADAGDGFMLERGYVLVKSGWQGDILPGGARTTARFPVATDGTPIQKVITAEFTFGASTFSAPIGEANTRPYLPVEESMAGATLYRRAGPHAPREVIPRGEWSFAQCPDGVTMTPSQTDLCLPARFSPDFIYELVYEARDPTVMGLGFAATRDVISFLRYDASESNPLVEHRPSRALGFGSSQSGRYLKDLIYQGFNQDESGRMVFDGAIPHISGSRKTWTNFEFAFPGRFSQAVENHYAPGDQFSFAYETLTDPISGKTDGVLHRCREQGACPKTMHWDSSTEAWAARASLVVTDPLGMADVPIPDNVRVYLFSSTQHGPAGTASPTTMCQQLTNPNQYRETQRALLHALQEWVTDGHNPPPSRVPRIGNGTLVPSLPQAVQGFPAIPGVRYTGGFNDLFINDEDAQPPEHVPGTEYTVLVPRVDEDGNDIGGVRSVTLQAPLGTYTGWNLRRAGFMEDESCGLTGSFIPFATTRAERLEAGDPRLSLEERYGTHEGYVEAVQAAAANAVAQDFLLPEDAERLIQEAEDSNVLR